MKKILVVEDESTIRELVAYNLRMDGYVVVEAADAESAYAKYSDAPDSFDVALLDIMLPGISGLSLCEMIRRENSRIGIIMLSAKTLERDKVTGLSIGADDYVAKPFGITELVARVNAVYRRSSGSKIREDSGVITLGDFTLNKNARTITKNGVPLELTQVEFQIMELFFERPDTALDRESILKRVWGQSYVGDVKIVDVNIRRLRMKIEEEPSNPKHILTVWGYGYRWDS